MFAYPGAPCIYYGDEIGLKGAHDPDCRRGFPWDDLRWNYNLLNYTKAVIALRKEYPPLRRGSYQRLYSEDRTYAFGRKHEGKTLIVVINNGDAPHKSVFSIEALAAENRNLTTVFGPDLSPQVENNHIQVECRPVRESLYAYKPFRPPLLIRAVRICQAVKEFFFEPVECNGFLFRQVMQFFRVSFKVVELVRAFHGVIPEVGDEFIFPFVHRNGSLGQRQEGRVLDRVH